MKKKIVWNKSSNHSLSVLALQYGLTVRELKLMKKESFLKVEQREQKIKNFIYASSGYQQ